METERVRKRSTNDRETDRQTEKKRESEREKERLHPVQIKLSLLTVCIVVEYVLFNKYSAMDPYNVNKHNFVILPCCLGCMSMLFDLIYTSTIIILYTTVLFTLT